jgi:hypothetical protein
MASLEGDSISICAYEGVAVLASPSGCHGLMPLTITEA